MSLTIQLKDYEPKGSHHIFLDTNVLHLGFSPIAEFKGKAQEQVTKFFEHCRSVGTNLYVTSLVLSEFYNLNISESFKDWQMLPVNAGKISLKKDFRPSEGYKSAVQSINSSVKNILKIASPFPDSFNNTDMQDLSELCFKVDFNDAYFMKLAEKNDWLIFSRDRDIVEYPNRKITVLTNL